MELTYENNRPIVKLIINKQELKKIMKENTSVTYKKFMENYIDEICNTTMQQYFLMNYFITLKTVMYEDNTNIWTNIDITHDKDNFYVRIILLNFYDIDFEDKTNEQLGIMINNKFTENEKVVLSNYLSMIPNEEQLKKGLMKFSEMSYNVDELLKEYKEQLSVAKEKGEKLNRNIKQEINFILFGNNIINVLRNTSENIKDFLEENYGKKNNK